MRGQESDTSKYITGGTFYVCGVEVEVASNTVAQWDGPTKQPL